MVIANQPPERTLVLTRVLDAPRERVFGAWTEPDRAERWWAPKDFIVVSCVMDVRVGGVCRIEMRAPGDRPTGGSPTRGTLQVERGVYQQVVPPEWVVFTWATEDHAGVAGHETLVTIRLEPEGEKTRLTLHQAVFETTADRDAHRAGWTSCLDRLADFLDTLPN